MKSLLALALLSSTAFAGESLQCELSKYYPDLNSGELGVFRTTLSIETMADGLLEGQVRVAEHNPQIGFREKVTAEEIRYTAGENETLDAALEKLGVQEKVAKVKTYTFGAVSNRGAAAFVFRLLDANGERIDDLAFVWGAMGLGSCNTHELLVFGRL